MNHFNSPSLTCSVTSKISLCLLALLFSASMLAMEQKEGSQALQIEHAPMKQDLLTPETAAAKIVETHFNSKTIDQEKKEQMATLLKGLPQNQLDYITAFITTNGVSCGNDHEAFVLKFARGYLSESKAPDIEKQMRQLAAERSTEKFINLLTRMQEIVEKHIQQQESTKKETENKAPFIADID